MRMVPEIYQNPSNNLYHKARKHALKMMYLKWKKKLQLYKHLHFPGKCTGDHLRVPCPFRYYPKILHQ